MPTSDLGSLGYTRLFCTVLDWAWHSGQRFNIRVTNVVLESFFPRSVVLRKRRFLPEEPWVLFKALAQLEAVGRKVSSPGRPVPIPPKPHTLQQAAKAGVGLAERVYSVFTQGVRRGLTAIDPRRSHMDELLVCSRFL